MLALCKTTQHDNFIFFTAYSNQNEHSPSMLFILPGHRVNEMSIYREAEYKGSFSNLDLQSNLSFTISAGVFLSRTCLQPRQVLTWPFSLPACRNHLCACLLLLHTLLHSCLPQWRSSNSTCFTLFTSDCLSECAYSMIDISRGVRAVAE